ncbi:MAG: hypothetical protein PVF75_03735 [Granulosicoccaceae bacterium]
MDFLDFEGEKMYFDEPLSSEVQTLLDRASEHGRDEKAEQYLMRAYFKEPNHLTVLVALYRYFYYKQRLADALVIGEKALEVSGKLLGLRKSWDKLNINELGQGVMVSMGLTRFYLHVLKAVGFILLRMHKIPESMERLNKLAELDASDQFGARPLIDIARKYEKQSVGLKLVKQV